MESVHVTGSKTPGTYFHRLCSILKRPLRCLRKIGLCVSVQDMEIFYTQTAGLLAFTSRSIQDKDKIGVIMVRKCFVIHEEVIDVFCDKFNIPTIEIL